MRPGQAACAVARCANWPRRGFTLVELLVVMGLLCVLSAAALPSFQGQLARGRRADGQQALLALAQGLERHYADRGTYAGAALGAGGVYPALSAGGYYGLTIVHQSADGYTLAATPQGGQAADGCATLGYNHLGERSVNAAASLATAHCW